MPDLADLKDLYSHRNSLSSKEGEVWVDRVSELLHSLASMRAAEFDGLTPMLFAPLSESLKRVQWQRVVGVVRAAIADLERYHPSDTDAIGGQSTAPQPEEDGPGMDDTDEATPDSQPEVTTASEATWDVFICHASEDKESVAAPLAHELHERGFGVWFDGFTLRLGDSLRRSIDRGLAACRFGAVILSPDFFTKEWPQRELDGLTAREIAGRKVILPIWHKVGREEVERYSPVLADRLSASTADGVPAVADAIMEVLGSPEARPAMRDGPSPHDTRPEERRRQANVLRALRNEWILSNDGISPQMMAGLEALPKDWVERRLAELGEKWRRDSYLDYP